MHRRKLTVVVVMGWRGSRGVKKIVPVLFYLVVGT